MAADKEPDVEGPAEIPGLTGADETIDAMMGSGGPPPPERSRGRAPMKPSADTEKTLGLEVGRLFGLNPRLLVDPEPSARPRPPAGVAAGQAEATATDETAGEATEAAATDETAGEATGPTEPGGG